MKLTKILQQFKEFADQKFSINHLHKNSDKLSDISAAKNLFTATQILNFIYKSLDVLHVEIFLCSRKEKLFKESKKEYFMADEDTFFYVQQKFSL